MANEAASMALPGSVRWSGGGLAEQQKREETYARCRLDHECVSPRRRSQAEQCATSTSRAAEGLGHAGTVLADARARSSEGGPSAKPMESLGRTGSGRVTGTIDRVGAGASGSEHGVPIERLHAVNDYQARPEEHR